MFVFCCVQVVVAFCLQVVVALRFNFDGVGETMLSSTLVKTLEAQAANFGLELSGLFDFW